MYVRPETLTLLYLSIFLAVILRWDRFPRLSWVLPFVQVAWVNSHGLVCARADHHRFALVDAALRFGLFGAERRKWWRTVLSASLRHVVRAWSIPISLPERSTRSSSRGR